MKGIWWILFLFILSFGCIGEESQIKTIPEPTTAPPATPQIIEAEVAPTTPPPSPEPTEPPKPVAEYLQKNGINLDQEVVDNLEASGLTENNKEFLEIYKNFYPPYLIEQLPLKKISQNGTDKRELAFMHLASKTAKTNNDKYFPVLDKILSDSPSSLEKLNSFDDKKTEQILSAFGDYVTNMQINYLKTALDIDMEDVAFDARFNGEGYSAQFDEERLLLYKNFTSVSENFEKMSLDAQIFILETEWAKQNKTSSENIAYINTIPITFNPNDKTKDSDGGGIFDIEEIKRMGDILSTVDDATLRMKYEIIKNGPFLTIPHFLGDMTLYSYYDLDTNAGLRNVRNYRGNRTPCDGPNKPGTCPDHPGIDYKCEVGTPVLAAAPGIIIRAGTNPDGAIVIIIDHLNGFYTEYGHLDRITLSKNEVARGEEIGLCGNTGKNSAFPHLHFELRNTTTYSATDYYYGTVDPYRDELNPNSKSYWINDNDPLCLSDDNEWKPLSKIK